MEAVQDTGPLSIDSFEPPGYHYERVDCWPKETRILDPYESVNGQDYRIPDVKEIALGTCLTMLSRRLLQSRAMSIVHELRVPMVHLEKVRTCRKQEVELDFLLCRLSGYSWKSLRHNFLAFHTPRKFQGNHQDYLADLSLAILNGLNTVHNRHGLMVVWHTESEGDFGCSV